MSEQPMQYAIQYVVRRTDGTHVRRPEGGPFSMVTDVQGGYGLEKKLGERFAEHHVEGKWFRDCQPIRAFVAEVTA